MNILLGLVGLEIRVKSNIKDRVIRVEDTEQ